MKKRTILVLMVALLCSSVTFTSCIGSFRLSNKVLSWNKQVSGSKFVNEVVFFCFWVLPVYEITTIADVLVVNSIEFWSGDNPLAENEIEKSVHGEKGEYLVRYKRNGYRIINRNTKTSVDLIYDKETKTWSAMAKNKPVEFMTFLDDNTVRVYLPGGKTMNVQLSESGVATFKDLIERDYANLH